MTTNQPSLFLQNLAGMKKYGLPIHELIIAHRHLPQFLTLGSSARLKLKKRLAEVTVRPDLFESEKFKV